MDLRPTWSYANALWQRRGRLSWIDGALVLGLAGMVAIVIEFAQEWETVPQAAVEIDLHPAALIRYTFFSLSRGLLAYVISLIFTLAYGYWAANDAIAERVLLPLLDVLQSVPVLGFMPGVVLGLVAAFPSSNVGLELAAIIMIFTGQAWNMTFSFYYSLRSIPPVEREVATLYHFNWWQRFKWMEVPSAMMGLVWNSMMSMAGGWFFLMIIESFRLGHRDFRLPGIGSYMSVAVDEGHTGAMLWAIFAMVLMIVTLDQLLWRPVVVWAQKFRVEEGAGDQIAMTSWFLDLLRRSRILAAATDASASLTSTADRVFPPLRPAEQTQHASPAPPATSVTRWTSMLCLIALGVVLFWGAARLAVLVSSVSLTQWEHTLAAAMLTLVRVLISTAIGTLWALPAGLAIGLSPRLSRIFQPIVQVVASFPAPMLFPLVIAGFTWGGISLGWGSILLMLLGTQWYILFNVIAGAMTIPADLREAAKSYRIGGWRRFTTLYAPGVFPFLVTGWITAAGGAWNASIVAEYVTFRGQVLTANGLGAQISDAAQRADFSLLAASLFVMSAVVVVFNRTVWRRCYSLAQQRFSLSN
ncbi:MAG: ABC transporter permease subunit [Planctomycetia bacterium]|nr:ABC transporter permease subunit [Planctomycetia bacterium]